MEAFSLFQFLNKKIQWIKHSTLGEIVFKLFKGSSRGEHRSAFHYLRKQETRWVWKRHKFIKRHESFVRCTVSPLWCIEECDAAYGFMSMFRRLTYETLKPEDFLFERNKSYPFYMDKICFSCTFLEK